MRHLLLCVVLSVAVTSATSGLEQQARSPVPSLDAVIAEALAIGGDPGTPAFAASADAYRAVLEKVKRIDR